MQKLKDDLVLIVVLIDALLTIAFGATIIFIAIVGREQPDAILSTFGIVSAPLLAVITKQFLERGDTSKPPPPTK